MIVCSRHQSVTSLGQRESVVTWRCNRVSVPHNSYSEESYCKELNHKKIISSIRTVYKNASAQKSAALSKLSLTISWRASSFSLSLEHETYFCLI